MQNQSQPTSLPPQQISIDVLIEKYAKNGETTQEEIFKRVAKGVASVEKTPELREEWEKKFYDNMMNGAVGAGRIMSAAGSDVKATLLNCFSGDTVVLTTDGPYKLKDLVGQSKGVYTRDGVKQATFQSFGEQEIYEVDFSNGQTVRTTAGHDWLVVNETESMGKPILSALDKVKTIDIVGKRVPVLPVSVRPSKNEDFEKTLKLNKVTTMTAMVVRATGEFEEVFCAVEPETHSFTIEGGILTGNCYVVEVGDALDGYDDDGRQGIYEALRQAAVTMQKGGGVGYNFSFLRPKGSWVNSVHSTASGPCSYMDIFDASCRTIESAGSRRGAQLGALNIDHPDILEFVTAKRTVGRWNNFNVSVLVTDEFMEAKNLDKEIELVHKAKPSPKQISEGAYQRKDGLWVYGKLKARDLWDTIMRSNYDYAEPGILFKDNINNDNNLRYIEELLTTNPCGEVPLPPNGCCDLGPIVLPRLVKNPFTPAATFDFSKLKEMTAVQVRFLDNVLDASLWPLESQQKEAASKRRIGVGFTGLANAAAMLNLVYHSAEGLAFIEKVCRTMKEAAYAASIELAKEKGPFPSFNAEKYLEEGTSASRLPEELKEQILKHGIRNSHLLSIAPTGTVSLAFADNASNGLEPPFSLAYTRKKRDGNNGHSFYNVLDHGFRVYLSTLKNKAYAKALEDAVSNYQTEFNVDGVSYKVKDCIPKTLVTALEMTADEHMSTLKVIQPFIDQSLSKTINVSVDYPFEDFKKIYDTAWGYKLKGVSTYRPNDILGSVLSVEKPKEEVKPTSVEQKPSVSDEKSFDQIVDEMLGESFQSRKDGILQGITTKGRFFTEQGEQKFIVTVNFTEVKRNTVYGPISITRPVEFILTSNFTTNSSAWDATMRFMSLSARSGVPIPKIIENLKEITWEHGAVRYGTKEKDGRQVPLWHGSDVAAIGHAIQEALTSCGYLDEEGKVIRPRPETGASSTNFTPPVSEAVVTDSVRDKTQMSETPKATGKKCHECGAHSVIKADGCERCVSCGWQGSCG